LSGARRSLLHRRVADAIAEVHTGHLDDHLPALAHHYARVSGTSGGIDKAVEYAARAGNRALAQLAHDEAADYYRQALELLNLPDGTVDEAQRLELLIALGGAERRAGDPVFRQTLLDAARLAKAEGNSGAMIRAALANNRGTWTSSSVGLVDAERVAAGSGAR
jgi:hypothetical protein